MAGIVPTVVGGSVAYAVKVWVAVKPVGSVAVTLIVEVPCPPAALLKVIATPDRLTVTALVLDELAE